MHLEMRRFFFVFRDQKYDYIKGGREVKISRMNAIVSRAKSMIIATLSLASIKGGAIRIF